MARRVVFIQGTGRSGSTVLDLLLGGLPGFRGLGEVFSFIRRGAPWLAKADQVDCACGRKATECAFWARAVPALRDIPETDETARYQAVLQCFWDQFGQDQTPVDSSKSVEALERLAGVPDIEVVVVRIIRDVRAWTESRRRGMQRHKWFRLKDVVRKYNVAAPFFFARRFPMGLFWEWYLRNRCDKRYLEREGIRFFQLGYEELTLYPHRVWPLLREFLGLDPAQEMPDLASSGSHTILGNRMRIDVEKRQRLQYDGRWTWSGLDRTAAFLNPHIMRFNAREVYSNVRQGGDKD